jgi:hypothetical protein
MSRVLGAMVVLLPLFLAQHAFAQSGYVEAGIAMDARRFSGQPGDRVFDANASSVIVGGGGFMTAMLSAGVELDAVRESSVAQTTSITISGRPETITTTFVSMRRTVSALFGVHSASTRMVRVGAYAGLAFTALRQRIESTAPPIVLSSQPPPSEFTHLGAMPIVGVDVSVSVSHNVAIVGVARAQSLSFGSDLHGFSIRPGAALRLSF